MIFWWFLLFCELPNLIWFWGTSCDSQTSSDLRGAEKIESTFHFPSPRQRLSGMKVLLNSFRPFLFFWGGSLEPHDFLVLPDQATLQLSRGHVDVKERAGGGSEIGWEVTRAEIPVPWNWKWGAWCFPQVFLKWLKWKSQRFINFGHGCGKVWTWPSQIQNRCLNDFECTKPWWCVHCWVLFVGAEKPPVQNFPFAQVGADGRRKGWLCLDVFPKQTKQAKEAWTQKQIKSNWTVYWSNPIQ